MKKTTKKSGSSFSVVGIGASAGGLDAFKKLLKEIPIDSGSAYVLVQHLDPTHESLLADLLQKVTALPVLQIKDKIVVEPDHIYIIPINKMLVDKAGVLQLRPRPGKGKPHLPIDLFFTSLAEAHGAKAIGIVLSGTGSDGTLGLKAIKDYGGITLAQKEDTAEYVEMPKRAIQGNVADFILSPEEMPAKLLEITKTMHGDSHIQEQDVSIFNQIISLLRVRKGTDFTYYKQTTIHRRILRRMAILKFEEPGLYLKHLRENKKEQDALYQDLLIPVTNFFRDADAFENLSKLVFPKVAKSKSEHDTVRIWVAGCSTGEEAYSIAICMKEFLGRAKTKVQIFATDISEPAIAKARAGVYSKQDLEGVSTHRLQEFFTKTNGSYTVCKEIRDMCVFALHNFLNEPPFHKMDLISCRNVLIYMEQYLQKKALTTFHYSLNPKGFLFLGKSERSNSSPDLFISTGNHDKLFIRQDVPGRLVPLTGRRIEEKFIGKVANHKQENVRMDFQKEADDLMFRKYTPPGVVVNEALDVMHYNGNTGPYLEQAPGKPTHNLLKLAKAELGFELRSLLHKAKKNYSSGSPENQSFTKDSIPVNVNGNTLIIGLEVIALPNTVDSYYLILFHSQSVRQAAPAKTRKGTPSKNDYDLRIEQLERELRQTREDLRGITEDQEAYNEELQSANEELQSGSEELQSLNEELETSKEELESTNEELSVVNQEMISMNEQITAERNYSEAVIATIREPLLVLSQNLHVKSANDSFYEKFRANEQETEGQLIFDLGNRQWNIPELRTMLESILPAKSSFSGFEVNYDFPDIGPRIMLLNACEIIRESKDEKLILLAIEDITEQKELIRLVEESEMRFRNMLMQSPVAFSILKGEDMIVEVANNSIKELWGKGDDIEGKKLTDILPEIRDQGFSELLQSVYATGEPYFGHESKVRLQRKGRWENVYFNFVYQPYREADGTLSGVAIIATEVTSQAEFNHQVSEAAEEFRQLTEFMPDKIATADTRGNITYCNQKWLDYTGLSTKDMNGLGWKKIMHPDDMGEIGKRMKRSVIAGSDFEMEHRCLQKTGIYEWHLTRAQAVKNESGEVKRWIISTTEINKIKEDERRKDEFMKMVSHELKTPVTSIKGYVQMVLEMLEKRADPDPVINTSLVRVDRQITRLARLISELLDLARLNDGKFELNKEVFDLDELALEVIQDIRRINQNYDINLHSSYSCNLNADRDRMGQVIINFVTNAIKYSPGKKQVDVAIEKEGESQVKLSVKDHGIGIDKEHHHKIFDRFYRAVGSSQRQYAGFGIGLFMAREIIQRHSGFVSVESKNGEGSVFSFTLPVEP